MSEDTNSPKTDPSHDPTRLNRQPVENPIGAIWQPPDWAKDGLSRNSLARKLFEKSSEFDFFQAVRYIQRLDTTRVRVGGLGPPSRETVRFRAHVSLSFHGSWINSVEKPTADVPMPVMVQAFMGLTGHSGVLPAHYTELVYRLEKDVKSNREAHALRDWFDLFNHRLVSLFYLAWEKYRFYVPFERGEFQGEEPDPFTTVLYSLMGQGNKASRNRLKVVTRQGLVDPEVTHEKLLARIEDIVLLRFSGAFAHRPRNAAALEAMLQDHFQVPARIMMFQGRWLRIDPESQTCLGQEEGNSVLGVSAIAGDRVWDQQSKFRVQLGPLDYKQFEEFLPDRTPNSDHKAFFLLSQLVKLYADPSLDFEVQLILKAHEIPQCRLGGNENDPGTRLGWNTWVYSKSMQADAMDVMLQGDYETHL